MVAHNTLSDTKVRRETTAPAAAPNFVGEVYVEDNADTDTGRCIRVADSTATPADFVVVGLVPQGYAGDPNGFAVARCVRDLCIDVTNDVLYYSPTAGSTDWNVLSGGAGGGGS